MILNLNRDWELKYTDQETAAAIVPVNRSIFASKEEAEAKAAQILGSNVGERTDGGNSDTSDGSVISGSNSSNSGNRGDMDASKGGFEPRY